MSPNDELTWAGYLETRTRSALEPAAPLTATAVPGLTIVCHPDVRRIGERVALTDLAAGRRVAVSRLEPLFADAGSSRRRPLADPFLSRKPISIAPDSANDSFVLTINGPCRALRAADDGSGVIDLEPGEIHCTLDLLFQGLALVLAERVTLLFHLMAPAPPQPMAHGMVGESLPMLRARRQIEQMAPLDAPVLIRGETGTGKELVARALHEAGRQGPFLSLNMGAVSPSLAASELFGVAKGAFTGADRPRPGFFVDADGGTLFLDEIGEAPIEIQVALLRVLETGEVQPVGGGRPRRVDVRVIAATDADLDSLQASGSFRDALRHRLAACEIDLAPLRERRDDVARLLVFFLRRELEAVGAAHRLVLPDLDTRPWLGAELLAELVLAYWPGNVRQVRNVARSLAATCREETEARLEPSTRQQLRAPGPTAERGNEIKSLPERPSVPTAPRAFRRPEEVSETELRDTLRKHRFRLQPAAAELRVSRATLYRLIDRFPSVRKPRDLGREEIAACLDRCAGDLEAMVDELQISRKGLRRRMTELGFD